MADVLVFHHAQGLTPGIREFASVLEADGHRAITPDLFEGLIFDTVEAGVDHAQDVGFDVILERGRRAAEEHPETTVYAGFSLGVMPAQMLAQTRPEAKGALLYHACAPPSSFGERWPRELAVQVHGMDGDPYFVDEGDLDSARSLVEHVADGELFLYPGSKHLFADTSLADYEAAAAGLLVSRTLDFLRRVDPAG